jgi:hypothetical protein
VAVKLTDLSAQIAASRGEPRRTGPPEKFIRRFVFAQSSKGWPALLVRSVRVSPGLRVMGSWPGLIEKVWCETPAE